MSQTRFNYSLSTWVLDTLRGSLIPIVVGPLNLSILNNTSLPSPSDKLNPHQIKFTLYEKEMSPVKVLLLGATGHTGRSILDGLTENGNYVGTSRLEKMWFLD